MRAWWLVLVACGGGDRSGRAGGPPPVVGPAPSQVATPPVVAPAAAPALRVTGPVHGLVARDGEALRYTPCDGGAARPLVDTTGVLAGLWASLGDRLRVRGFGAEADGGIRLERVDAADPAGESAACPALDHDWLARGTEPFWSMTVRGDRVVFEQPDEPRRVEVVVTRELDTWRSVPGAKGWHPLELTVEPTPCTDAMSGAWASHTATAKFDARTLKGCASPVAR